MEEDIAIAPDFYAFMSSLLPVLREDRTLSPLPAAALASLLVIRNFADVSANFLPDLTETRGFTGL